MKKLLIVLAAAGLVTATSGAFAAETENTANVHLTSVMTNLNSTAQLEIDATKLANARGGTPFNEVVATGCAWTNQTAGDLNQRLSVNSTNYEEGGQLALYGIDGTNSGQKVKATLYVSSSTAPGQVPMPLNQDVQLQDHADPNANATGCANVNSYHLEIAPTDLVNAKSGHYEVAFAITASNYTG